MTLPYQDILKDAERYRWLKNQKGLHITSNNISFCDEYGNKFTPEILLSANRTQYGVYATFDQTIDAAMKSEEDDTDDPSNIDSNEDS